MHAVWLPNGMTSMRKGFAFATSVSVPSADGNRNAAQNIENEFDFHSGFLPKYSVKKQSEQGNSMSISSAVWTCAGDAVLCAPKHRHCLPISVYFFFAFCNAIRKE